MTHELKRVDPMRAANVGALLYGLMMAAFSLIVVPFLMLLAMFTPADEPGAIGFLFPLMFLFLYPVMGLVMGWISGLLASAIYNFIIRWTGGLLFEFEGTAAKPSDGAA